MLEQPKGIEQTADDILPLTFHIICRLLASAFCHAGFTRRERKLDGVEIETTPQKNQI